MRELLIFVDPFGTRDALKDNVKPLKEAIRWVRNGAMLGLFPAGEVSHLRLPRMKSPILNGLIQLQASYEKQALQLYLFISMERIVPFSRWQDWSIAGFAQPFFPENC